MFGSSNWTDGSNKNQYEHNYFANDPSYFAFFREVFLRKWNSTTETKPFVPLPPGVPTYVAPKNTALGQPITVKLQWKPGNWAHFADVYFGTTRDPVTGLPPLYKANEPVVPAKTKALVVPLEAGKTYYWFIVSKTAAMVERRGSAVWSFGT